MKLQLEEERTRRTPPLTSVPVQEAHAETGVDPLDLNQTHRVGEIPEVNQPGRDEVQAEPVREGCTSKARPIQGRRLDYDLGAQGTKFYQAPRPPEEVKPPQGRLSPSYVQTDESGIKTCCRRFCFR